MAKTYITFGQAHTHKVGGVILDKDCVAVINHEPEEDGRAIAFKIFGRKFCFEYPESYLHKIDMDYFPRGLVEVPR